ncbi:uncharacterized protein J3R85_006073 [Psidium guajava]|nr:uncharacterized protein J3R85_006073 [Psidium guajava]
MANRSFPVRVRSSSGPKAMSASDGPKLPQHVVDEILKRLPVESLLRCRCVSRSWRSAIDDPRFVALHLNHSALDASNWHFVCLDEHLAYLLFSDESLIPPSESQIEIPFVTPSGQCGVVGSCNGLICVAEMSSYGFGATYLWNFFTRRHKEVPRSGLEHQSFPVSAGFGFDARWNDYKIVRILSVRDEYLPSSGGTNPRVEIYSLRTDSWRSLECRAPAVCWDEAVFLNGNLHWFASKVGDPGENVGYGPIVLFDVADEVFDEMAPPPVEISQLDTVNLTKFVAVLNGSLAVFISLRDTAGDQNSVCSVWVMGEYGVTETWAKLYSFEVWGGISHFYGLMRNGELLMIIANQERVSWDPITGEFTNLPPPIHCDVVAAVESLVSPQR